nr:hypothetical protein CFP56_07402 [Quercus suber]
MVALIVPGLCIAASRHRIYELHRTSHFVKQGIVYLARYACILIMLLFLSFATLLAVASARSVEQEVLEILPSPIKDADFKIPSVHESTIMARRILHLSTIGTLVTTFPDVASHSAEVPEDDTSTLEVRPPEVAGQPIGLMEYYADCEATGNPTLLAISIATPFRNYAAGSNISMHVRWWPETQTTYTSFFTSSSSKNEVYDIPTPRTPAALPRFSLHGYLKPISADELLKGLVPACFLKAHPDSALWQPGNDVHTSRYMRLVVEQVYWFGGFGDRARIGWLPIEEWRNVTMKEVASIRLPGESTKSAQSWWKWL